MKRRRLVQIILGCVAAIMLAVLIWPREREPEYNGLTVSNWVAHAATSQHNRDFLAAIKNMGTNAIPPLMRKIRYEKPRWRIWLAGFISKTPKPLRAVPGVNWLSTDRVERDASAAMFAFLALGSNADSALPELNQLANSKVEEVSFRASMCINFVTNASVQEITDFDITLKN